MPIVAAQAFLEEFGEDCARDLIGVAARLGLQVQEVDVTSFDGALIHIVGHSIGTVAIRAGISEDSRKRFTLAHELGHYILPGQQGTITAPCAAPSIESWSRSLSRYEIEANQFAAEILMPRQSMSKHLGETPTLEISRDIATSFDTSLTASTFRLVELSSFRTAMVVSRASGATWYQTSNEFGRAIRIGELDNRTLAYDLCQLRERSYRDDVGTVPADAWLFEQNLQSGARIWEQSAYLPSYEIVLTLLVIREHIEIRTDFDEDEGEPLDPQEFTIRRKRWPR